MRAANATVPLTERARNPAQQATHKSAHSTILESMRVYVRVCVKAGRGLLFKLRTDRRSALSTTNTTATTNGRRRRNATQSAESESESESSQAYSTINTASTVQYRGQRTVQSYAIL